MDIRKICCVVGIAAGAVAQAIMAPKVFIPSFILGAVIGSVAAVAKKHFSRKDNENAKAQYDLKKDKIKKLEPVNKYTITLLGLAGSTIVNSIACAVQYSNPAVPPFVPFISGSLSLATGLGLGIGSGYVITNKIISYIDQRALKNPKLARA
jgi:hypothetical protein